MIELANKIWHVIQAADLIGADNAQFGDALYLIAECVELHGDRNKYIFSNQLQDAVKHGAELFDNGSALEFLLDVEMCRREYMSRIGAE